jgi:hypothetical protein
MGPGDEVCGGGAEADTCTAALRNARPTAHRRPHRIVHREIAHTTTGDAGDRASPDDAEPLEKVRYIKLSSSGKVLPEHTFDYWRQKRPAAPGARTIVHTGTRTIVHLALPKTA